MNVDYGKASESEEQQALFQWADIVSARYPELKLMYHVPNGGQRSRATAGRLKAEGVKSGVPDICIPVARGGYHGLYLELKVKPNKPTENQIAWIDALNKQGYLALVCYGWRECSEQIEKYLRLK